MCLYPHRKLIDRIDKNKDGKLTKDELKEWIRFAGKRWMYDDTDRLWKHFKKLETHFLRTKGDNPDKKAVADPNAPIAWDLWKQDSFGDQVSGNLSHNHSHNHIIVVVTVTNTVIVIVTVTNTVIIISIDVESHSQTHS